MKQNRFRKRLWITFDIVVTWRGLLTPTPTLPPSLPPTPTHHHAWFSSLTCFSSLMRWSPTVDRGGKKISTPENKDCIIKNYELHTNCFLSTLRYWFDWRDFRFNWLFLNHKALSEFKTHCKRTKATLKREFRRRSVKMKETLLKIYRNFKHKGWIHRNTCKQLEAV